MVKEKIRLDIKATTGEAVAAVFLRLQIGSSNFKLFWKMKEEEYKNPSSCKFLKHEFCANFQIKSRNCHHLL